MARTNGVAEQAISVRLDRDAQSALELLLASGLSRSEAIRQALIEAARSRQAESLALEAKRLADDPEDRQAIAEIAVFMEALSAEG